MKRKFETNVATELPKTRASEPGLPWKLSDEDLDKLNPHEDAVKAAEVASPPLRTRAVFPILLVVTIFILLFQAALNAYIENEDMQQSVAVKQVEVAALQAKVEKISGEKEKISENSARLEKRIEDLSEQKELFTAALESLTKRSDEIVIEAPVAGDRKQ